MFLSMQKPFIIKILYKSILIFIFQLLILSSSTLFAQPTLNEKYWDYKDNLNGFIQIGTTSGMSLPATWKDTVNNKMSWSDNSIILGWYIAVLASEYVLLNEDDFPDFSSIRPNAVTANKNELYYALKALERLDAKAESSFPCDSIHNLINGFFIRDDVPLDFHKHFKNISIIESDYSSINVYDKEMSQDQAYHLLLGLSLVKRFVPDSLTHNGLGLRQFAIDQALLILEWIQKDKWIIKNPVCSLNNQAKDVSRGANTEQFSAGINEMVKYFSDGNLNYNSSIKANNINIWNILRDPSSPAYQNEDNMHMVMSIAAVGNAWSSISLSSLMDLASKHKWYVYPLLNVLLHNNNVSSNQMDTLNYWSEKMLLQAPLNGPYSTYPQQNSHGYAVNLRFLHDSTNQYKGKSNSAGQKYSGLDYMLLHNLYYLANSSLVGLEENNINNIDFTIYPIPFGNFLYLKNNSINSEIYKLEIYSVRAKLLYEANVSRSLKLNTDFLSSGLYLLRISDNKGNVKTLKLIKK